MPTTEEELTALMRLMDNMEESLREMQDDYRVMRDDLEEFLLTGSDSPSTTVSTSSAAATPEHAGQKKGERSNEQQSSTRDDRDQKTLAIRGLKRPRELFEDGGHDA